MALESFYGGKQGVSPVIKAKFKYVNAEDPAYQARIRHQTKLTKEEARWLNDVFNTDTYAFGTEHTWDEDTLKPFTMDECLKDVHYTDVWYGELCIIDTDNKLNPYNGMLFKRTLKQVDNRFAGTELTLYAEYIGQIVGPSGGIPNFDFGSLDVERKKAVGIWPTLDTEQASESQPLDTSNWDYSYPKDELGTLTTDNPQNDYTNISVISAGKPNGNIANIQMVPGKVSETKYNDTIRYTWCNVRRRIDGKDDDAWVYLGFEIPYTIYDVTGIEENYTYNESIFIDSSDESHPFYKNYEFHIPRGARGIGPEEIFCINPKDSNTRNLPEGAKLYTYDAISYDQEQDKYIINQSKIKTINNTDSYWVGKWCIYNPKVEFTNTINTDVIYVYLGSYKDVRAIQLGSDGSLTFTYSDNSTYIPNEKLTWITSANVNNNLNSDEYGQFTVTFNNNDHISNISENLHLIKSVTYTDNTGKIKFDYSGDISKEIGTIEYDKNISINTTKNSSDYGKVTITKNTGGERTAATLPLIKSTEYHSETGKIDFIYSGLNDPIAADLQINDIEDLKIADQTNNTSIILENNEVPVNGHLYVLYRWQTYYEDLGQAKTKPVIAPVLQIKNTSETSAFTNLNDIDNILNGENPYTDPNNNNIIVKPDGTIEISGEDATGGTVAATVKQGSNETTYIYYYDPAIEKWINIGALGTSNSGGSSAENLIIEEATPAQGEPVQHKFIQDTFITFKDGTNAEIAKTDPIIWPWNNLETNN